MTEYVHPRDYKLDDLFDGDLRLKDEKAVRLAEMPVSVLLYLAILEAAEKPLDQP